MENKKWEARSALRYGSKHEGFFDSYQEAEAFALKRIEEAGNEGGLEAIINNVLYYSEFDLDLDQRDKQDDF